MTEGKKFWTWEGSLVDHARLTIRYPLLYLAPFILSPNEIVAIFLGVNSVIANEFCSEFFAELARIVGIDFVDGILSNGIVATLGETRDTVMYEAYGRSFAEKNGLDMKSKYNAIKEKHNIFVALSVEAVTFFAMWGTLSANTIMAFITGTAKMKTKEGSNAIFEIIFILYYGWLYLIIFLAFLILKRVKSHAPQILSMISTLIFAMITGSWIVPYGFLSFGLLILKAVWDKISTEEGYVPKLYVGDESGYTALA